MSEVLDFIKGQEDCKNGVEHKSRSDAYDRGYSYQYWCEQEKTERTSGGGK